jgi:hypothetical protein
MKMKASLFTLGFALLAAVCMPGAAAAADVDAADQQISQAIQSKDANRIIEVLPVIEKIWPQKPEAYFASVKDAAGSLDAAKANPGARGAISNLFSSMIQKSISGTPAAATSSLEAKKDAILYFLNFPEVREDKTNLLALAGYIGTIREQIISNFVPKTVYINPPGLMDASPAQAQQILQQNEQNAVYNNWQQTLVLENTILSFQLRCQAGRLSVKHPENAGFVKDLAAAAHLTAGEEQEFH